MKAVVVIAALLVSTAAAQAQHLTKVAASGQKIRLDFAHSLNPDCSPSGAVTIRITKDADHGRVVSPQTRDFPRFPESSSRSICNTRRVQGNLVSYTSQRGFTGTDSVVVEYFFPAGTTARRSYTIHVR